MDNLIRKIEAISLSNDEVMELINGKANLIQYPQLYGINSLDEILEPYGACVILYLTRQNYGHWCCVFKLDNNSVEFFDPYGLFPDEELKFRMDPNFRKRSHEDIPMLSYLLDSSPYNLSFNHHKFQKRISDVKTCGRHTAMRLICRNISLDDYINLFTNNKYDADFLVTMLTAYI